MKTRDEMIYDFMLALCSDLKFIRDSTDTAEDGAMLIYHYAALLSDTYLKGLG